ncbi:MAG TPA: diguanylate cyclase [Bryobacteraceae bacterium]|jgi:two-component system, cell cycle response regulator|nr:diguanylate cyclase [Bryobacteraceae bacterium]
MDSLVLRDNSPPQILVADDSPVFRDLLQRMLLEWGYEVTTVTDGQQAWDLLRQENGPRLALLDWMMPGMEGAEVCRRVRDTIHDRYVYMMLLSVRSDLEDVVKGMESGADDYIVKPFQVDELRARLRAGRRVLALQEELVEAREALREQATRDGLTGLWNRTAIFDILQNELARSSRSAEPLIALMADLDGFKPVNDHFGHMAGDAVLRQVSARMRASVRRYDAVGRYGGEEFLIVLPGCELAGGVAMAERIRDAIASECFRSGETEIHLTCSLGAAAAMPPAIPQADDLVRAADAALYRAKRQGRNRVEAAGS